MTYAIEVLRKEKDLISRALSTSDWKSYPESRKRQAKKHKQLTEAIELLIKSKFDC